jgi:DNA polymerase
LGIPEPVKWNADTAVEAVASFVARPGFAVLLERWGDLLTVISSSLRGLFVAAPGHRLICSDYRAIEAVVLAALAGEQWRLDVFHRNEDIYLQSASKIKGTTVAEYLAYAERTGEHHPDRQLGKVAELASGYGGGIGAWKNFHADDFLSDEQIEDAKRKWRQESPNIKRFWYKLEDAAKKALRNVHTPIRCRSITYVYDGRALRCILPSGRALVYQNPSLKRVEKWGRLRDEIWFWGMNSNAKYGRVGVWMEMSTYGGKLCENVTQATARDIMAHGMLNTDRAGYPIVLHVHDEEVAECPDGFGTVEGLEACMNDLPAWARTDDGHRWPVDARGGWAGREYRKD